MKKILLKLIHSFDRNIHPKRVEAVYQYFKSILFTLLIILGSILFGVFGFMVIEGFTFIEAVYMTIITISTVGYGEIKPLSNAGRVFVSILIITNIGVFAYSVGNIADFILSGNFRKVIQDLLIGRKIDNMKNHIIVCGYGRYGHSVIDNLLKQNIECVLIETNHDKIHALRQTNHFIVLEGDATDESTLIEAGIDHARALIITLPDDADNVYTTLTARQLNQNLQIICRANIASSRNNLLRAGADQILIPENIGGFYMSALVSKPDIIQVFTELSSSDSDNSFRMAEIILDPLPSRLLGRTLGDLQLEKKAGIKVIGTKLKNKEFDVNPSIDTELKEKMAIVVLGNKEQIERFHMLTKEFDLIE